MTLAVAEAERFPIAIRKAPYLDACAKTLIGITHRTL